METTDLLVQLPKKINNRLVTQKQIGDSHPFWPLELIAMYAGTSLPTKGQQTGDNLAKKERNTSLSDLDSDNNSVRVYDLIVGY